MKTKKLSKILIVSLITLIGFAIAGTISIATTQSKENKILDKVSTESNTAMRDLRWARVALFDGQPESAKTYLDGVKKNLEAVKKQAPELIVTVNTKSKMGDKTVSSEKVTENSDYVPIDAWLVLSEDFVATPEKNAKIKEANKHLKSGDKDKAIDVLRTADIGVSVGRMLMPLNATIKHVDKAIDLMSQHKYYEANLALKGAEDGVIVDSVMLVEPATSPSAGKAIQKKMDNKTSTNTDKTKKG
jgi:primosomal protein N''